MKLDLNIEDEFSSKNVFDYKSETYTSALTEYALTNDSVYTAKKVGVPLEDIKKLMELPKFQSDIKKIQDEYLQDGISPFEAKLKISQYLVLDELINQAMNAEKSADRREAAKLLLQMGGKLNKEQEENTAKVNVSFSFSELNPLEANKQALEEFNKKNNK